MLGGFPPKVAALLRQGPAVAVADGRAAAQDEHPDLHRLRRTDTVQVTLNGHFHLTDAPIEDGLPRLGAQLVEQRLNEALLKAMAAASEATDSDRERLDAAVAEITGKLRTDK
ncbi:hypothetical protein C731_0088 [Mycolicibacterium hassiacum DSM 44199]|uniref:Uncharacterized protein n=1 Tax=Mycolicibacterium hassiacum (strain DSM 44199 / CIP 105218 / JCM 12690 / 3849) TaxID=1122247 RepID=K5BL31_MYCHD|nr:hypothetical protein C731_0088 [Mycolicibacterium hassiacum DSM 44199]